MIKILYATALFSYLWFKINRMTNRHGSNVDISDLVDRVNNLERGFIFVERDVNNGLEGGTAISTNNRVIDGIANPVYRGKTVKNAFIGQTLEPNILGLVMEVGPRLNADDYSCVTVDDNLNFVTHLSRLTGVTTTSGRIRLTDYIRREFNINSLYRKVLQLEKTFRASYSQAVSSSAGSGPVSYTTRQFATDRLWRYGQLIVGRQLLIDDWHLPSGTLQLIAPVAIMSHNIDILDSPVINCNIGTHTIGLELERELANVLVVCDEGCTVPESYLKCGFKTIELGTLQFKRAKGYSYVEIPTDLVKAKEGDLSLILKLKTTVRANIYHQIGGI